MRKNYFLSIVCLLACVLFSGNMKAEGLADILGTYQFTATMTVSAAGEQYKSMLSDNCEVKISSEGGYVFMDGLAGSDRGGHMISDVKDGKAIIKNWNDSNTGNFGGALFFSTSEGVNPWGGMMPDLEMTIAENGDMTLPDFTIVTCGYEDATATVLATFTNAKLTLQAKETTTVSNISGNYTYTHGNGTWDYDKESTYSPDFTFSITAKDETNTTYTGVFNMGEGFTPLTLEGTFDGMTLKFPYDKPCLDEQNQIYLGNPNNKLTAYGFKFGVIKSGVMSLDGVVTLLQLQTTEEKTDTLGLQWYVNGKAECPELKEQGVEVDFTGTYNVKCTYMDALEDWAVKDDEFTLTIGKDDYGYFVSEIAHCNEIPYGGLSAEVDKEDANVLNISPSYLAFVSTAEESEAGVYKYIVMADMNGQYSSVRFTAKADGTFDLDPFCTLSYTWGEEATSYLRYYNSFSSITKQGADTPKIEIAGDYTFTGTYCTMDDFTGVEKKFNVKIEANDYYEQYGGEKYLLTEFDGDAIYSLTYGGAGLAVSDENADPVTLDLAANTLIGGNYPDFLCVCDFYDKTYKTAITITLKADGTCAITDFCVNKFSYDTMTAGDLVGWYSNCTLTRGKYTADAIMETKTDMKADNKLYNLNGQRVQKVQKGLYILNGKKYLVK